MVVLRRWRGGVRSLSHQNGTSSGASTPKANEDAEGKTGLHKIISSKAGAWIAKKGLSWPWNGNEQEGPDAKNRFVWPWFHNDQESGESQPKAYESSGKTDGQVNEGNQTGNNEASGSWSSYLIL